MLRPALRDEELLNAEAQAEANQATEPARLAQYHKTRAHCQLNSLWESELPPGVVV